MQMKSNVADTFTGNLADRWNTGRHFCAHVFILALDRWTEFDNTIRKFIWNELFH